MEELILNNIQYIIGTEPKPIWTTVDEQALDNMLKDFDFKSINPDISYNQFKDFAYDSMYENIAEEIIVSGFEPETFEKGGVLYYQQGVTGDGIQPNTDYVDLTGSQYFDLVNKVTGQDKSRRAARGREEISNLASSTKPSIRLYKNGRIEYLGGGWNTGAGTGEKFTENRPGLIERVTNAGENKAQAIHQRVAEAIRSDNTLLDQFMPKKAEGTTPAVNASQSTAPSTECGPNTKKYAEFPNECLSVDAYQGRLEREKSESQDKKKEEEKPNPSKKGKYTDKINAINKYYTQLKKTNPTLAKKFQEEYKKAQASKKDNLWYVEFGDKFMKDNVNKTDTPDSSSTEKKDIPVIEKSNNNPINIDSNSNQDKDDLEKKETKYSKLLELTKRKEELEALSKNGTISSEELNELNNIKNTIGKIRNLSFLGTSPFVFSTGLVGEIQKDALANLRENQKKKELNKKEEHVTNYINKLKSDPVLRNNTLPLIFKESKQYLLSNNINDINEFIRVLSTPSDKRYNNARYLISTFIDNKVGGQRLDKGGLIKRQSLTRHILIK